MTTLQFNKTSFPNLHSKVAIITGASSGIGLATAQLFASQGAKVIIADLQPPPDPIPSSHFIKCDVTAFADVVALFDGAVAAFGHVDILIANAGVGEVEDIFDDEYDGEGRLKAPRYTVVEVNLKGVLSCVKVAVSYFRRAGRAGRIVMTSSTAGYMGEAGLPVYSATKHGIIGLMRALRTTAAEFNISINCVAPWMTDSKLMYPELRALVTRAGIPIQQPASVAAAMAYTASESPFSGMTVYVAGDTFTELEGPIMALEKRWLGERNAELFRAAQGVRYFTSKSKL